MRGERHSRPIEKAPLKDGERGTLRELGWEEYLERKLLLDRAREAQVTALKELYDRYRLRLLLVEKQLPHTKRRALMVHIAGDCRNR